MTATKNLRFIFVLAFLLATSNAFTQKKDTAVWYTKLPACPCRNPDFNGVVLGDGWAKDKGDLKKYHRGAAASYRSYPATKTTAGHSCQQCCYDVKGNLITSGRGAGTPDKKSACSGENKNGVMTLRFFGFIGHYWSDVRPWNNLMKKDSLTGWIRYNVFWLPNNGSDCKINIVSDL